MGVGGTKNSTPKTENFWVNFGEKHLKIGFFLVKIYFFSSQISKWGGGTFEKKVKSKGALKSDHPPPFGNPGGRKWEMIKIIGTGTTAYRHSSANT